MKRLLKIFAILVGTGFATLLLLATVLWMRPEILLNETNLKRALPHLVPEWKISWNAFRWDFKPMRFLEKESLVYFEGLCVTIPERLDTCFHRVALDFHFALDKRPLLDFTRLDVQGKHLTIQEAPEDPTPEPDLQPDVLPDLRPPSFAVVPVDLTLFEHLDLDLPELKYALRDGAPWLGRVHLRRMGEMELEVDAKRGKSLDLRGRFQLTPSSDQLKFQGIVLGRVDEWRFQTPLDAVWGEDVELYLSPELRKDDEQIALDLAIHWSPTGLVVESGPVLVPDAWPGRQVSLEKCFLRARLHPRQGYPEHSQLECSLRSSARDRNSLLTEIEADVRANVKTALLRPDRVAFDLDFSGRSEQDLFRSEIHGGGRLELAANLEEILAVTDPSFNASVVLERFELWKEALDGTAWAIPAPFRTLRGPIRLQADLASGLGDELSFQVRLDTELAGGAQRFLTRTEGNFRVRNPFGKAELAARANVVLRDVRLEAPPLHLEEPPQFLPDPRFVTSAEAKKEMRQSEQSAFEWALRLATEQPVRIGTDLFGTPVPFKLDLALASAKDTDGIVEVQSMPVEIFKRKAQIEFVRLEYHPGSSVAAVDGLLLYRNPEVLVRVLLLGNTREPRVEFESEPPLGRQQIVSLLLFNRPLHELTEDEASSAGNMSQALADGAFGLFSLMFLSSTPIQSVGYDPVSQAYSVQLRIGTKTTVSVSSDFEEERRLGVRRRLGGRWAIRTELQQEEERGNVVLTLLEWFRRF